MLPSDDLEDGDLRLLSVDNRVVLPEQTHIRVIITAADVLHCWAIPSAGVKLDACPGRLNQTSLFFKRQGTFFGQCSEICGVNHAFMPIVVESKSLDDYITWIQTRLEELIPNSLNLLFCSPPFFLLTLGAFILYSLVFRQTIYLIILRYNAF